MKKFLWHIILCSSAITVPSSVPVFLESVAAAEASKSVEASIKKNKKTPGSAANIIIVDVNGERRRIELESGITVVRGDLVTIIEVGPNQDLHTLKVDVVGFASDVNNERHDDLGKVIDTARDLDRSQASGGRAARHKIKISGKGLATAETVLSVLEPALLSFDVEVNGQVVRLNAGDRLSLKPQDKIRVLDIRTNVRGNENVKHDLITIDPADRASRREIRFSRGDSVFARIPIEWKGS